MGQRYYEGNHDIENYRLYYYNENGKLVEDKNRSNIKISHPFFSELVEQAAQYLSLIHIFNFPDNVCK